MSQFDISPEELSKWMRDCFECPLVGQVKDKVIPTLEKFGGPAGLCVKLSTASNTGIKKDQVHSPGNLNSQSVPSSCARGTLLAHLIIDDWHCMLESFWARIIQPPCESYTPCCDAPILAVRGMAQCSTVNAWVFPDHGLLKTLRHTLPFCLGPPHFAEPPAVEPNHSKKGRESEGFALQRGSYTQLSSLPPY